MLTCEAADDSTACPVNRRTMEGLVMSKMRVLALLVAALSVSVIMSTTKASACPSGYSRCGNVCCPR